MGKSILGGSPAEDCLLLVSSRPDGHCCVETANLDGETNLKKKAAAMTSEEFHAARFQWLDELCLISTYFNILGFQHSGFGGLVPPIPPIPPIHPSIIGFYQTPSLLVLQDAAWNCRRIGPGCSPSLLCEAPNGDLYSFKSSLCSLENLDSNKDRNWRFFDSETMWISYFMIFTCTCRKWM